MKASLGLTLSTEAATDMPVFETSYGKRAGISEHKQWCVLYRDQGLTLNEISRMYDVGQDTVANTLKRLGVKMRPRGGQLGNLNRKKDA